MRGVRVAVTGAGGFIGSTLVRRIARGGASVRALVGPVGVATVAPPSGVEVLEGEIDRREVVDPLVAGCEVVVHVAGPASVAASFGAPAEFARIHVVGTATLLDASRRAGVRRFVHLSSAEVYGRPVTSPVSENHRLEARSPYGAAKLGAEAMVEAYRLAGDLETVVLRPFSVYGPRQSSGGVVATILAQALAAPAVELHDPDAVRDFCFVDDVADAVLAAAAAAEKSVSTRIYNVGSGAGTSIGELARLAVRAAGRDAPVRRRPGSERPAGATVKELVADPRRIRADLGWSARTPLADGLRVTIDWLRTTGEQA